MICPGHSRNAKSPRFRGTFHLHIGLEVGILALSPLADSIAKSFGNKLSEVGIPLM
jgi:hypothetical protein